MTMAPEDDSPASVDLRHGHRLATSLPAAIRFPDGDAPEGWGRIFNISTTGVKLESRWPLRVGQSVYLTFEPQKEMRLENLRAKVIRVSWEEGYYVGGLAFDDTVDHAYLREALIALLDKE